MDLLNQFPRAWCSTCGKVQAVILDVMKADDENDHDAADIVCDECKSVLVTLHARSAPRLQSLGNSHPAARLYLGPHAASVVRESAPCRAAVVARDKIGKTSQATKIAQAARDSRT